MLIVLTRVFIIYIVLFITMRLMGKKQLGELQPFEFTITLVASELACIPMSDIQVPIFYGIIPIITLLILEVVLTKCVKHSVKLRKVINGKPSIVINSNGIDYEALNNLDMTVHDLLEALRQSAYLSPSEVEYAIVETNGAVSCIPKGANKPASVIDVFGVVQDPKMPYSVICEGKELSNNILKAKTNKSTIDKILNQHKMSQKDVLLLSITNGEDFYLQPIKGHYIQGKIKGDEII